MKTISCYRQETVHKKPRNTLLITLAISAAFIAGVLLGNTTHIVQDVAAACDAGEHYLLTLYQGSVARDVSRLVGQVEHITELFPYEVGTDSNFIIIGP